MPERTVMVAHQVGLHARPAASLVKEAAKFRASITVRHGEKTANAKSIIDVLGLGAGQHAEVVLTAEGDDAEDALDTLERVLSEG
jgi:phosphotransferase system HPr (HPr) family protein